MAILSFLSSRQDCGEFYLRTFEALLPGGGEEGWGRWLRGGCNFSCPECL